MAWDLFERMFQSCSRPWSVWACGSAVAFSVVYTCIAQNENMFYAAFAGAVAVVTGQGVLRTIDKRTAANASSTDKQTEAVATGGQA